MEHHASLLAKWLTQVLGLAQHPWPGFSHGAALSVLDDQADELVARLYSDFCARK